MAPLRPSKAHMASGPYSDQWLVNTSSEEIPTKTGNSGPHYHLLDKKLGVELDRPRILSGSFVEHVSLNALPN